MRSYDLAIIGSGPGGYIAALYACRHNLRTCVIEKELVGGTCLNRGCIPTKSLLNSAALVNLLKESATYGIDIEGYRINFSKMMSRKNEVTDRLRTGIETLFRANKIELIKGSARLTGKNTIEVSQETITARHIIIAAGSRASGLPGMAIDEVNTLSSDGALCLKSIPAGIMIVGGGVVGCEFASLFNSLGSKVTIVEMMDRLIPALSREASKKLALIFKKRGIEVLTSAKAGDVQKKPEKVLVSVGRISNIDGLGLGDVGIGTARARIEVDSSLRTDVKNIFAIGDCVAGPQLAHKASYDGILAVDNICGRSRTVDYSNIPNCIWTDPEIATVGLTEEEARSKYPDLKTAKFPYLASGKAFLKGRTEGYIKILGDAAGSIIGVEIMGDGACDLISEAVLARRSGIKIGDWANVVHGHPTMSEMFQEACHVFCGTPIHGI